MNKKLKSILILMLLFLFCLSLFAACKTEKVDFFSYSEQNLGWVGRLIKAMHGWISNYGWTVVVFTVFLKIAVSPLDFWQRYSSRKSALKMQQIQPLLEAIDKRYGANTQRANEEKQKLYKKQGYSMLSSCLPMIVSMVIFFVMFGGLREYSTYSNITSFRNLTNTYYDTYVTEYAKDEELAAEFNANYTASEDKSADLNNKILAVRKVEEKFKKDGNETKIAQISAIQQQAEQAVKDYYLQNKESWLWIQNVWQPDTWDSIMPPYSGNTNSFAQTIDMSDFTEYGGFNAESLYNQIRDIVIQTGERGTSGAWNGLMILPILSIGLSFLSMFISQRTESRRHKDEQKPATDQQQAMTNKTMMIIMPLMMAFFGFMYTGAFAIYMVVNYTMSIISTVALRIPVDKAVQRNLAKQEAKNNSGKASYMR